jgi:hypothetical protein
MLLQVVDNDLDRISLESDDFRLDLKRVAQDRCFCRKLNVYIFPSDVAEIRSLLFGLTGGYTTITR